MIEYVLWFISFISLFVSLVWFSTFYLTRAGLPVVKKGARLPTVTIAVPAYNEEEGIIKTLRSLIKLDYPKEKLHLIVVDDGSADGTYKLVSEFIKKEKPENLSLITQENGGKASALNAAIKASDGELFGCVDADSTVSPDSLRNIVPHFADESQNVGAVVSTIRVRQEKNFLQKMQRFEYIFTSFFRKLLTSMDVLYVTPGVLSVYSRAALVRLGGFDEHNITEDLEMGLRLQHNKYKVLLELGSKTYTDVPKTLSAFWRQRIRWLRGHVHNSIKYKDMLFNREYGFMGMFQFPLNVFSPVIMLMSATVITYGFLSQIYWFVIKFSASPYLALTISFPTMRELVLGAKLPILFPMFIITVLGVYLYHQAHKYLKEAWMFPVIFIIFLVIYPAVVAYIWVVAIIEEIIKAKKEW